MPSKQSGILIVSEAERSIRTIKERMRGIFGTLLPRQLKMEFLYFIVLWLNTFPARNGIWATYSPRELLICWKLDYKKHCRVLPGTYCETHDEPVPMNTMTPWTHACIVYRPTVIYKGVLNSFASRQGASSRDACSLRCPCRTEWLSMWMLLGCRKSKDKPYVSPTDPKSLTN